MKKENKKKWKFVIFLSCLKALAILTFSLNKIFQDFFEYSLLKTWIIIFSVITPLAILITFHTYSQCIFMLTIPQIVSKRGRMFLIAAAFLIALSGPTKNLIRNGEILAESLSCSQDQVRMALKNLFDAAKEPYKVAKKMVAKLLPVIKRNIERIKGNLLEMKQNIVNVVRSIKKAFLWLENIVNVCNEKEGSPFAKCEAALDESIKSCRDKFGPFSFLCESTNVVKGFCYLLKPIEYFCEMIDFISDDVLQAIEKKMKNFIAKVEEMAIRFHNSYMTSLRYKNIFISNQFLKIDKYRCELGMDQVMPLTHNERKYLIQMTSIKLARYEWRHLLKSTVFLLFSTLHLCGIVMADYSLFWIVTMIRFYGSQGSLASKNAENDVDLMSVNVSGHGIMADFCKELVNVMRPLTHINDVDFVTCLPHGETPNFKKYEAIAMLVASSWIILFFEPYSLRLRNVIMEHYYPKRSDDRVNWLYHEILKKRTGFTKFARKQLKEKLFSDGRSRESPSTCMQILRSKFSRFWIFRKLFGYNESLSCLVCSKMMKHNDDLIRCETDGCIGAYCIECFNNLRDTCPLCRNLLGYSDASDIDEEV
ncbi:DC-STAMP domain-containing protein 2-like [Chironomus tepperi]|uniref:DC-STAMP domain-containing protein 2-like n=1 Tax=Chironomus tepperi TaxID=113505 RepID=UPI00391F6D7C